VENTDSCLALLQLVLDGIVAKVLLEMVANYVGPMEPTSALFVVHSSE
jgi:hypothetical protein